MQDMAHLEVCGLYGSSYTGLAEAPSRCSYCLLATAFTDPVRSLLIDRQGLLDPRGVPRIGSWAAVHVVVALLRLFLRTHRPPPSISDMCSGAECADKTQAVIK